MGVEIVLGLLFVMVLLVAAANRLKLPYPILLVIAGLGIGFVPGLPRIELDPNLVFFLFLPPIIQLSAFNTPTRDFRQNLRSIGLLAVGLVLATMFVVAIVAHAILPELPWAALGLFYGQPRFNTMTPDLRIQGVPLWDIVVFVLNGLIFILVGLQLPSIVARLPRGATLDLIENALIICLALILVRMIWVFPGTYLPRLPSSVRARDPFPPVQNTIIVGWAGMRGGVSLATALALPYVTDTKAAFPQREEIIFVTFVVILVTLVVQGLTLPLLIQRFKVFDDGGALKEENKARLKAAQAAQARLQELAQEENTPTVLIEKLIHQYEARIKRYSARYHGEIDEEEEEHFTRFGQLEQDLLQVELEALVKLRNEEIINDEVMRRVQHDLDLEWLRLQDDQ